MINAALLLLAFYTNGSVCICPPQAQIKYVYMQDVKMFFGTYKEMQYLEPHPEDREVFVNTATTEIWVATRTGWKLVGLLGVTPLRELKKPTDPKP